MNDVKGKRYVKGEDGVFRKIENIPQPKVEVRSEVMDYSTIANRPIKSGIFIPVNVPSSKNSKRIVTNRKTSKPMIIDSALAESYRRDTKGYYIAHEKGFKTLLRMAAVTKPYRIEFYFVRSTKQRFDHHNAVQLVMDMMVEHGWIDDDNANEAVAVPPKGQVYHVDKINAGVYIMLLKE